MGKAACENAGTEFVPLLLLIRAVALVFAKGLEVAPSLGTPCDKAATIVFEAARMLPDGGAERAVEADGRVPGCTLIDVASGALKMPGSKIGRPRERLISIRGGLDAAVALDRQDGPGQSPSSRPSDRPTSISGPLDGTVRLVIRGEMTRELRIEAGKGVTPRLVIGLASGVDPGGVSVVGADVALAPHVGHNPPRRSKDRLISISGGSEGITRLVIEEPLFVAEMTGSVKRGVVVGRQVAHRPPNKSKEGLISINGDSEGIARLVIEGPLFVAEVTGSVKRGVVVG